jgi:hypothetical protein
MISLLHDPVTECTKCLECKIIKPLLIRAERLLDREPDVKVYGNIRK